MKIGKNITTDLLLKNGFRRAVRGDRYTIMEELIKDISINIWIDDDLKNMEIDILDENFLQPYDYQWMLKNVKDGDKPNKYAVRVKDEVVKLLSKLEKEGIIEDYNEDEYIFTYYYDGKEPSNHKPQ